MDKPQADNSNGVDLIELIRRRAMLVVRVAVLAGLLVLAWGGVQIWFQEVRWSASVGFQPSSMGTGGLYPNGLAFSVTDIVDSSVLNAVYDANQIQTYCSRDAFQSAFFIQQTSVELAFLALDYEAKLADVRLTAPQREMLENQYRAKRASIAVDNELVMVSPLACNGIPQTIVYKVLSDVLTTWARDAEARRGVLRLNVEVVTPAVFAATEDSGSNGLLRALAARNALTNVASNITKIRALPGANLIRMGEEGLTFSDVNQQLEDLQRTRLQPLVALASRSLGGPSSVAWLQEMLSSAKLKAQTAKQLIQAYLDALHEYSGTPATPPSGASKPPSANDGATMTQLDQSFIDRIIGLSNANTLFRQTVTSNMMAAANSYISIQGEVDYLTRLANAPGDLMTPAEAERQLKDVIDRGKELIRRLDALYQEFSRVSLRYGALFQITVPPRLTTLRSLTWRQLGLTAAATATVAFVLGFVIVFLIERFRRPAARQPA